MFLKSKSVSCSLVDMLLKDRKFCLKNEWYLLINLKITSESLLKWGEELLEEVIYY